MGRTSSTEAKLLEWYGRLTVRRVDLVGDYAGQELFLLEGDSLLLRCFSDARLDFDRGFQLLHAVYIVEYFLQGLVQRKCNFHIVFFEANRAFCIPKGVLPANRSKYLLARAVVQRHLEVTLSKSHPSLQLKKFESVNDLLFQDYLRAKGFYFVMCHDGASPAISSEDEGLRKEGDDTKAGIITEEAQRKKAFRTMICYFMNQNYNIALINELEWQDTKVISMVVEGSHKSKFGIKSEEATVSKATNPTNIDQGDAIERLSAALGIKISNQSLGDGRSEASQHGESSAQSPQRVSAVAEQKCRCVPPQAWEFDILTERVLLSLHVLGQMMQEIPNVEQFSEAFLIHVALIGVLPLSTRRYFLPSPDPQIQSGINDFLIEFSERSIAVMSDVTWMKTVDACQPLHDICDLIDGRLLEAVIIDGCSVLLDATIRSRFQSLARALCTMTGIHLGLPRKAELTNKTAASFDGGHQITSTIMPFSDPIFDKHLAPISLNIVPSETLGRQIGRIYQEVTHWHNAKKRLDLKNAHPKPISRRDELRALRRNQFFMAEMQAYAASLTNAAGKALEPETVTVHDTSNRKNKDSKISSPQSQNAPKTTNPVSRKNIGKKSVLDNIAANKASKDSEDEKKAYSSWREWRAGLDKEQSLETKYIRLRTHLGNLPPAKRTLLRMEVEYHQLCVLVEMYLKICKGRISDTASKSQELFGIAGLIWDTARRLMNLENLTKTITQRVPRILEALGLPKIVHDKPTIDRELAIEPNSWLPDSDGLTIGLNAIEFQLLHCGPYMDRNLDSSPDKRVPFTPDGWQIRVLDELDADNSVFVVAPTSAGKTFISFYAMEKILRSNDDSVLVYVAPTKALVNQIAAEIQARFKKTYKYAGKSVWAIHTRDYRINNPAGCQILVTVPHILQIMLLAPSNARSWSSRVKRIIFDEIHSIGQAEDGIVWEQLLLLAPCPIIALSATVGNPDTFHSWLKATQESSGHSVTMVVRQHRYSDLRKFSYTPPKKFAFRGLSDRTTFGIHGLDGMQCLSFIHPVASLVNKSRGIPDDLSFEARDCLLLWQALKRHANASFPLDPSLEPARQCDSSGIMRKAEIIEWEQNLKKLLKQWMANDESPFTAVLKDLGRSMDTATVLDKDTSKGHATDVDTSHFVDVDAASLYSTTLPLLCRLHERNALPAIFFNYDRHACEGIAKAVMQQLEKAETSWKETDPNWIAKIDKFEKWKKDRERVAAKKPAKSAAKAKGKGRNDDGPSSKIEQLQDAASEDVDAFANFDPDAPIDGFHFAMRHKTSDADLFSYFREMKRRGLAPWLSKALQRGIGVHHAGMNRKYRQIVEMLFRQGYLRVVIATGTLALGINMPCVTVVFSGDSIFLTALNFRQAAGRAGRRGFDLLGNVVFQNITHDKICRLLSSRLPDLNGHFPITTTLVLRLFTLLHESGEAPYAIKAIDSLLSQPRLYLDGPAFKDQVLHHLRFSIEYLRRQSLLSAKGNPINFAGLTSHLYFTENSSFALNALIMGEYFHELCSEIDSKESHVLRTLMVVMAHLFGRRPCRQADAEYVENIVKRSPSIVFLPPLPSRAAQVLREHNVDTLDVFTTYVRTFIDQHVSEADDRLPLTGLNVGGNTSDVSLLCSSPAPKIRSSFVALSGHGDHFGSISDLCRTTRSGVFLEEAVIPHLDVYPDESKTPLNAYLYDFFMHGDINALENANGVRRSDVWFLLNDFSLVLATIISSLANFLKLPDSDLSLEDVMGEGDESNNLEDDKFAADSTTDTESTTASTTTTDTGRTSITTESSLDSKSQTQKKKKKVLDSWDDSDAEDDEKKVETATNDTASMDPSTEDLEKGFLNIYKAMTKLRAEFDTKFRKIFA